MAKKAKRKEWFTIIAPKIFGEKEIGRTIVSDAASLIGRKVVVNLVDLTDDFSKYYLKLSFKISKLEGDKAFTKFDGSECLRDYISRMVLRRTRRVDTIQDLATKDGIKIRIKTLTIVPRRIKSSIQATIRNNIREMVKSEVENSTLEQFIKSMLSDEFKNKVLKQARKVYPVRNFEIRKTEIV